MNWAFLFLDILIPLVCIVFGLFADKIALGKINFWIGYRSERSTASREAWEFANLLAGRLLLRGGIAAFVISLVAGLLALILLPTQVQSTVCVVLTLVQTAALLAVIPAVEKKLKVTFE